MQGPVATAPFPGSGHGPWWQPPGTAAAMFPVGLGNLLTLLCMPDAAQGQGDTGHASRTGGVRDSRGPGPTAGHVWGRAVPMLPPHHPPAPAVLSTQQPLQGLGEGRRGARGEDQDTAGLWPWGAALFCFTLSWK